MIVGTYKRKIDVQDRVSIPWLFINELDERVKKPIRANERYIMYGYDPISVYLWHSTEIGGVLVSNEKLFIKWSSQIEKFGDRKEHEKMLLAFFSKTRRVTIYGLNNRMTIPEQYRHLFKAREVFLVGLGYIFGVLPEEPKIDIDISKTILDGLLWPTPFAS